MRACFNVVWSQKLISAKVARFRRINLEQPCVHHDALEFPDGQVVKLAWLCEGQHATVLQCRLLRAPQRKQRSSGAVLS